MSPHSQALKQGRSWVASANDPECGFPLISLPFCVLRVADGCHIGVGIGDQILDLWRIADEPAFAHLPANLVKACKAPELNALMKLDEAANQQLRDWLTSALADDAPPDLIRALDPLLHPMRSALFALPVQVGDYTDFYASIHHATNVGRLFRPDQPLLPNYKFVPIGYHGRASSLVVSGTEVIRPHGQIRTAGANGPVFAPSGQLDYELEVGAYVQRGNPLGTPVPIGDAERSIFGYSLLNDWSARDIQAWEYQPLGPFLGKSFATSVSPWVVPRAALGAFRAPLKPRDPQDPEPLPYLRSPQPATDGINLELRVQICSLEMRRRGIPALEISRGNARDLYWSFAQMVAHHTSNGCNLRPGDLLASGTVSGPEETSLGCLLEITKRGLNPITLPSGETRSFLQDGDEVILSGGCREAGLPFVSFGECRGSIISSGAQT